MRKPPYPATLLAALAVSIFTVPAVAQAQDENLCPILRTLIDASTAKFKPVRGHKSESHNWDATSILPYASRCGLDDDYLDKEVRYTCYFDAVDRNAGKAAMKNLADQYADNIAACRPELTRRPDPYSEDDTEFDDATAKRISVGVFDDFFTVEVYAPENNPL